MPRNCPLCSAVYATEHQYCSHDGARLSEVEGMLGRQVGGYRVLAHLSTGASGAVYRAHDPRRQRDVALKLLRGEHLRRRRALTRFDREAEAIRRLRHPNVVELYELGSDGPFRYLAMELVEGVSLAELLASRRSLPPLEAALIGRQIADALAAAHGAGLVHRDLKPSNVMLGAHGRVKIIDFGVVAFEGGDEESTRLTRDGFAVGTPLYMSPEQVDGKGVGPQSDLYALGVMLHELISGQPPFTGTLAEVAAAHAQRPPPPLLCDPELAQLVARLLAKRPGERPAGALLVAEELARIAGERSATRIEAGAGVWAAPPAGPVGVTATAEHALLSPPMPSRPRSRRLRLLWAAAALLLLTASLWMFSRPSRPRSRPFMSAAAQPVVEAQGPRSPPAEPPTLAPPIAKLEPVPRVEVRPKPAPMALAPLRRSPARPAALAVLSGAEHAPRPLAEPPPPPEPSGPPEVSELRGRLDRLAALLAQRPGEETAALYREYLEVRTEVRARSSEAERRALDQRIKALEERVRARR